MIRLLSSEQVSLAYFSIKNKQNEKRNIPSPDTFAYQNEDGSIELKVNCSMNFGTVTQHLISKFDHYLCLTVFSGKSSLDDGKIYLDQFLGKIPNDIGNITFGVSFPVKISGKLIQVNQIQSLDIELSMTDRRDRDTGFNSSVKAGCFFKTILPIWRADNE